MTTENVDGDPEIPPSPFPDTIVYAWLTFLEALIAAALVIFGLGILEGGGIVPDVLDETTFGFSVFIAVFLGLLALRLRK